MAESTGKRRTSIGVLFWIAFILLVLVIFLANRSNIEQVLETTGLVDVIRDRVATDSKPAVDPTPPAPEEPGPVADQPTDSVVFDDPNGTENVSPAESTEPEPPPVVVTHDTTPVTKPDTAVPVDAAAQDTEKPNRRMAALYFVRVTDDGRTFAQRVVRPVAYDDSPLTETIRALIEGPTGEELDEGLLTLIPPTTQLLSAQVDGGIAYLNFNEAFRFNPMGAEGTVAQLEQIIFASTEFPTVERVQFLIEGEKLDYVGGDGIYIGEPLGRDAFSS